MDVSPGSGTVSRAQELSSQSESSGQVSGFINCVVSRSLVLNSLRCKLSGGSVFSGQRESSKDGSLKDVGKLAGMEVDVGFDVVTLSPGSGNA